MKRFSWFCGASAAALVGIGAQAHAQDQSVTSLEDVVVTARRVEETAQTVPIAMTVTDSAMLKNANVKSLVGLQNVTPGITIRGNTNDVMGALVLIRGQGTADTTVAGDSSIGTYFDGVYIPRLTGLQIILRNSEEISRVEILRGPQGTLFGRNTTGGAINIVSKAPGQDFGGYGRASLGNLGQREGQLGLNVPLGDGAGLRLSTLQMRKGGAIRNGAGLHQNDLRASYYKARLRLNSGDRFTFDLSGAYQRASSNGLGYELKELCGDPGVNCPALASPNGPIIGRTFTNYVATLPVQFGGLGLPAGCLTAVEGSPTCPAGSNAAAKYAQAATILRSYQGGDPYTNGGIDNKRTSSDLAVISMQGEYELTDWLSVKSITGFVKASRDSYYDQDGTPYQGLIVFQPQDTQSLSQELQFLGSSGKFNYVFGAYGSVEEGDEPGGSAALISPTAGPAYNIGDAEVTNKSRAVFGQVIWEVVPKVRITGGLRYTKDTRENIARNHAGPTTTPQQDVPIASILAGNPPTAIPVAPFVSCGLPVAALDNPSICRAHFRTGYSNTSWLLSADWTVAPETLLYAKVSTGFKSGGNQLRGTNIPASFLPFLPEETLSYEGGVKSTFLDRRARVNASVWLTDYDNIQRVIVISNQIGGLASVVQNAAKARLYGVEFEGSLIPIENLTLTGSFSYFHGEYRRYIDGNIDRTPQVFGLTNGGPPTYTYAISANYTHPQDWGRITAYLNWRYQSKTLEYNQFLTPTSLVCCNITADPAQTEYVRGFGDLSGRVAFDIDAWNMTVAVFGSNLTNKAVRQYATEAASLGYRSEITQDPRTFGIEITKRFGGS